MKNVVGPLRSVTPNKLWKDVMKRSDKHGLKTKVLVDPETKVDNKFRKGIEKYWVVTDNSEKTKR